jgi:hypothetical protein
VVRELSFLFKKHDIVNVIYGHVTYYIITDTMLWFGNNSTTNKANHSTVLLGTLPAQRVLCLAFNSTEFY